MPVIHADDRIVKKFRLSFTQDGDDDPSASLFLVIRRPAARPATEDVHAETQRLYCLFLYNRREDDVVVSAAAATADETIIYSRRRRCASASDVAAQFVGLSKFNLAKVRLGRRMRTRQRLPYTYNIKNCHLLLLYTCVQIFVKKKRIRMCMYIRKRVQSFLCNVFFQFSLSTRFTNEK